MFTDFDIVIVGSGLFGSVIAERASRNGYRVAVIEARNHIGGNCYTENDPETGINIHKYGPHIFHTDSELVWNYITQFSEFNNYQHVSKSRVGNKTYPIPINLETLNKFFGVDMSPTAATALLNKLRLDIPNPQNFEEQALSVVGRELYDAFLYGYTIKQWDTDPKMLPASVAKRLPVRTDYRTSFYPSKERYQGIPVDGYTPIFEKMLTHDNITLFMNTTWESVKGQMHPDQLIVYTGPIDRYYDYQFGELNWRTLDFETRTESVNDYQGVAAMNHPDISTKWTREVEHKHFHPERNTLPNKTVVTREFSRKATRTDTPYYPVKTTQDIEAYNKYRELADAETNVIVGGRLGEYMYYDMHQVIGSALACYKNKIQAKLLT